MGFGFDEEPMPKKSFNLAPNDHFWLGAFSGRGSGLRASGGSGIIPEPPSFAARPVSSGGLDGEAPSSGLGTAPSIGWAPLGSVPARKISRRDPTGATVGSI